MTNTAQSALALYDFTASEIDELSVAKDERLEIYSEQEQGLVN